MGFFNLDWAQVMDIWYFIVVLWVNFPRMAQFQFQLEFVNWFWLVYYKEAKRKLSTSQHIGDSGLDDFRFTFDFWYSSWRWEFVQKNEDMWRPLVALQSSRNVI